MKKVITFLMIFIFIFSFAGLTTFAEEIHSEDNTPVIDEDAKNEELSEVSFFDRIIEAWEKGNILQIASLAATFLMLLFVYLLKKGIKSLGSAIVGVANKSTATVDAGVETMEESAKNTEAKLTEYGDRIQESLADLDKRLKESTVKEEQIIQIETLLVTLIKMFDNVYQHSKTIAAATKEQLAEDYNAAMRVYNPEVHTDAPMEEP